MRRATTTTPSSQQSSVFMSEANVRRMVDKLSRMRGAALKLGQFMSIQGQYSQKFICKRIGASGSFAEKSAPRPDSKLLPVQVEQIMMEVQNNANYMPSWQTEVSDPIPSRPMNDTDPLHPAESPRSKSWNRLEISLYQFRSCSFCCCIYWTSPFGDIVPFFTIRLLIPPIHAARH